MGLLRGQAELLGIDPTDGDLEAVIAFLATVLPALAELERGLPSETVFPEFDTAFPEPA